MGTLTDEQVSRIARRLVERVAVSYGSRPGTPAAPAGGRAATTPVSAAGRAATPPAVTEMRDGIFPDVDRAVEAATIAFRRLSRESLAVREQVIAAIRAAMLAAAEDLSQRAREETGLGRVEDKILKNRLVARKTPGTESLVPGAVSGDSGLTLSEPAPYGVIGAITPVTNPTSTIICNAIGMLAAGNAAVFNPHPSARAVSCHTIQLLNRAIVAAGGPANLVSAIAEPTIESAQELMRHPGVRLLVVTGGAGVVREAMRSGKRAICAGPGNPPVVVDDTADIERAARDIVRGASLDNNIICTDEKEVFVVGSVADALLDAMTRHGAYRLDAAELRRLERVIFEESHSRPAVIAKAYIGKDASRILAEIGVRAAPETRLAVAEAPEDHPLVWTEQMMPVLPIVRVENADRAIDLARAAEQGFGHSAVMHSRNLEHLSRMAREINTTIFVKNGPCYAGLGEGGEGYASFTIASPTGEGMTGPRSFSRQRRCVLVDHFRIV